MTLSKGIFHEPDAGGGKIDFRTEEEVREAFNERVGNAKNYSREKGLDVDPSRVVFVSDFARSSDRNSCPTGTRASGVVCTEKTATRSWSSLC